MLLSKGAISGFSVSADSAEALFRWGGKIKHLSYQYSARN